MRRSYSLLLISFVFLLYGCGKDKSTKPEEPPVAPQLTLLSQISFPGQHIGAADELCIDFPYAYVAGQNGEITIINVSDSTAPAITGRREATQVGFYAGHPILKAENRLYVYFANGSGGYFEVFDIHDPTAPVSLATFTLYDTDIFYGMAVSGNRLYAALGSVHPLVEYDISELTSPQLVREYLSPDSGLCAIAFPLISGDYILADRIDYADISLRAVTINRQTLRDAGSVHVASLCLGPYNSESCGTTRIVASMNMTGEFAFHEVSYADILHPRTVRPIECGQGLFLNFALSDSCFVVLDADYGHSIDIYDRDYNLIVTNDDFGGKHAVIIGSLLYVTDNYSLSIYDLP